MAHKIIFERIEKDKAYLKNEDNKTIVLPQSFLEKDLKEGDELYLNISKEDNIAKDILNELLDSK